MNARQDLDAACCANVTCRLSQFLQHDEYPMAGSAWLPVKTSRLLFPRSHFNLGIWTNITIARD